MLRFETPIWVRNKNDQYVVQSLFLGEPIVSDKRYEEALRKYAKALRKKFSEEKLDNEMNQQLLWYQFFA